MSVYNPAVDSPSMGISTRDPIKVGDWFSELQSFRRYPITEILMEDAIVKKDGAGTVLAFRAADDPGLAKPRESLYSTYTADKHAKMYRGSMPWRHGRETCAIDKREKDMNSGDAKVADEAELELQHMFQRVCDSIEGAGVNVPGLNDSLTEVGFSYFVCIPSNANGTFCGQLPGGATSGTISGLDPITAHPKYRNFANLFTTFSHDDFGLKATNLMHQIAFDTPPKMRPNEEYPKTGPDMGETVSMLRIFVGDEAADQIQLMSTVQNDQLGDDVLPMFTGGKIGGVTPTRIPALGGGANEPTGAAAANSFPFYFVNLSCLYPKFLQNNYFRESGWQPVPMSDMEHYFVAWSFNWECKSRRRQGAIAKASPFSEAAIQ